MSLKLLQVDIYEPIKVRHVHLNQWQSCFTRKSASISKNLMTEIITITLRQAVIDNLSLHARSHDYVGRKEENQRIWKVNQQKQQQNYRSLLSNHLCYNIAKGEQKYNNISTKVRKLEHTGKGRSPSFSSVERLPSLLAALASGFVLETVLAFLFWWTKPHPRNTQTDTINTTATTISLHFAYSHQKRL